MAASLWSVADDLLTTEAIRLGDAGLDLLHWDTTDGEFARDGGFTPARAEAVTAAAGLRAEAHLMVRDPLRHVDAWTGFCEVVTVHVEAAGWRFAVERIAARGATPAVAFSPDTVIGSDVPPGLGALVMSVHPGQGGEAFAETALARISTLRGRALLGVDGGVTHSAALNAQQHGATWIVSGTDILSAASPRAWLNAVRGSAHDDAPLVS
ncbi:hypothetical protein [Cellulomonas sp. KRMCY2]|uniref:hypothetical protein n=1 Tax=Cellulomonas sp. KRMCY2 TaxID=1304865 RepID=UPI00045EA64C|nr:hypothetical protein [Cellulomonas sp. KRMCY2]